ncbi:MAG: prepilin-type N-terminal cleavage/methylation domain-containing protein [Oscillospiraceae bacterium]
MKKSQKGFTLVELVVVIAIIGVLAAILVPSMLNYVKKSRLKTANSNAKTAYNAVAENFADAETNGYALSAVLTDDDGAAKWAISPDTVYEAKDAESLTGGAKKIADLLAENGDEAGCFKVSEAEINEQDSYVVFWAKTTSDEMVGEYPDAITWDDWKDLDTKPTIETATYKYASAS